MINKNEKDSNHISNDNKHAYLIMAHNEFGLLKELLAAIDDPRNDIYLHMDKKVKSFNEDEYRKVLRRSDIYFVKERIDAAWGGDTQIKCEMNLLRYAQRNHYQVYHLLSGVDYPTKSQNRIHDFFNHNIGKNFISYESDEDSIVFANDRIGQYHFLQNAIGHSKGDKKDFLVKLEGKIIGIQKKLGVDRVESSGMVMKKGSQWFSITDSFAGYLLRSERLIKKVFYKGRSADELFIMTMAYNSKFKNTIVNNDLRLTVWFGGSHPKNLTVDDVGEMLKSEKLFARKFSGEEGMQAVLAMKEEL